MPRSLILGNGRLTVCLDDREEALDFFYPLVGLENHLCGHKLRIGVWTENKFSWIGDGWKINQTYLPCTLVSRCFSINDQLGIKLEINDAVHNFLDVLLRKIKVENLSDRRKEIRLFIASDFIVYGLNSGDTAMFDPSPNAIIHYKRQRYFLTDGITGQNGGMFQYSTGIKESFGKEGAWKDAEDGVLENNAISQGAVDSVISFKLQLEPQASDYVYHWVACGKNIEQVKKLDSIVKGEGVEQLLLEVENFGSALVDRRNINLSILPREVRRLFQTSLLIMRAHVDNNGAILASCDSDILQSMGGTYAYVWPRDSSITAMAFDMAGFQELPRAFFEFCTKAISSQGYFHQKYLPDGSIGSTWHALIDAHGRAQLPIQEDESALVVQAVWKHFARYRDLEFIERVYRSVIIPCTDFLLKFRDTDTGLPRPSFDLWEEYFIVSTATTAAVCSAISAAAKFAQIFYDNERHEMLNAEVEKLKGAMLTHLYDHQSGRFIKGIFPDGKRDNTIDSSLAFTFLYGPFSPTDEKVVSTMNAIKQQLWVKTDIGGLSRYQNDGYAKVSENVPGNPWIICTIWLARWYIACAQTEAEMKPAMELLNWAARRAQSSGILAEQLNPFTGASLSVSPLTWSHAEFVIAVCEYLEKREKLAMQSKAA